jgi:signal transduction histidine kinase
MNADPPKLALVRLAEYLESQRKAITQQWLDAVRADPQADASNLLTHQQLLDRLPHLFGELCRFLLGRDAGEVSGSAKDDAREHGALRWEQGYRIEELLRELHLLRRILLSTFVTAFAQANHDLNRAAETTGRNLVEDFFSAAILSSVRQFLTEQQEQIADYASRLATSNQQLEINNGQLKEIAASRTQLTSTVAHELRNFLRGFSTALRALQEQAPQSDLVEIAQQQTKEMAALVDQLVEYSALLGRAGSPSVERFELRPLFDELVESFSPMAESKRLELRGEFDPRLSSVCNDRLKVRQIATNLLFNAVKYTESGEVLLAFSFVDQDRWTIAVSDTGKGIAREDQERTLEEWERRPETGLGPTIVKELAARLDGVVRLVSRAGRGNRFEVELPVRGRG